MESRTETKLYRSGEAARMIGIAHRTLQKYLDEGRVESSGTLLGGHRVWSLERINEIRAMMDLPTIEHDGA